MDKDLRINLPINFFFCEDEKGKLKITLNGGHIPPIKDLKKMRFLIDNIIKTGQKGIDEENKEISKQQEKWQQEQCKNEITRTDKRIPQEGFVYLLKSLDLYKIGRAKSKKRIDTYKTENPHGIKLIVMEKVNDYIKLEKILLDKYKDKVFKGEWFKLDGYDVKYILNFLRKK